MHFDSLDLAVVLPGFKEIDQLGHRDQQAVRQMITQFSVVCSLIRQRGDLPKILETGSGLSTEVFSRLISAESGGGNLISIDFKGTTAIEINSRQTLDVESVGSRANVELVNAPTISFSQLSGVYEKTESGQSGQSGEFADITFEGIDAFLDFSKDDRRVGTVQGFISGYLSPTRLRNYMREYAIAENPLIMSYRTLGDEFDSLRAVQVSPALEALLKQFEPNLVFLDSGEFSSLVEFGIVNRLVPAGTFLLVQDVLFPKSIKGFIIGSILTESPKWRVAWVDKTTAQGMILAEKLGE